MTLTGEIIVITIFLLAALVVGIFFFVCFWKKKKDGVTVGLMIIDAILLVFLVGCYIVGVQKIISDNEVEESSPVPTFESSAEPSITKVITPTEIPTPIIVPIEATPTDVTEPIKISDITDTPWLTVTEIPSSTVTPEPTKFVGPTAEPMVEPTTTPTERPAKPTTTMSPSSKPSPSITPTPKPTKVPTVQPSPIPEPTRVPAKEAKLPEDGKVTKSYYVPLDTYTRDELPDGFKTEEQLAEYLVERDYRFDLEPTAKKYGYTVQGERELVKVGKLATWNLYYYKYVFVNGEKKVEITVKVQGLDYIAALNAMESTVAGHVDLYCYGELFYEFDSKKYSWPGLEFFFNW